MFQLFISFQDEVTEPPPVNSEDIAINLIGSEGEEYVSCNPNSTWSSTCENQWRHLNKIRVTLTNSVRFNCVPLQYNTFKNDWKTASKKLSHSKKKQIFSIKVRKTRFFPSFFPTQCQILIQIEFRMDNKKITESIVSYIWRNVEQEEHQLRYFHSTVGQKLFKIEVAENFNKNVGILGCEEVARNSLRTILH